MTLERWWLWFLTVAVVQLPPPTDGLSRFFFLANIIAAGVCMIHCVVRHIFRNEP